MTNARLLKFPLLLSVGLLLILSLWTGLVRLGWGLPTLRANLSGVHGPLMVNGVLGTLICLERAVALTGLSRDKRAALSYLAPLCGALGGLLLILGAPDLYARFLMILGSLGLVLIFGVILNYHTASYTLVMACGALSWIIGNLLWQWGMPVYQVVYWWIAFLTLTIVGERLELSRIIRLSDRTKQLFLIAVGIFMAGIMLTPFSLAFGVRLMGVGAIALALWLLRYDIARHTVRKTGVPRFAAVCLLAGYTWLGIGGMIALSFGGVKGGVYYEALLHALLLGFVFSMIFGHAPIIIPAITGRVVQFRPIAYSYVFLLHFSLILREVGALTFWQELRQWSGMLNVAAILLFMGLTLSGVLLARKA
jgi:hypothetical protein